MSRTARQSGVTPWRPAHREIFRLANDDWTPPTQVKVMISAGGQTITFKGTFRQPNGGEVAMKTRCRRMRDGSVEIAEETLSFRFFVRSEKPTQGGGAAAGTAGRTDVEPIANGGAT
ncbi:hypothetical protein [Phenylobacterium sp.]|uniref:hypothetical protein n=1 Tax=Phenylobacterium sp. TaxID=1871053 RepID=UPI0035B4BC97